MFIDITLKITNEMLNAAASHDKIVLAGHVGTHFDVMNKEFPLEYASLPGYIFDVSGIRGREITLRDVDIGKVKRGMFVGFYTHFIEEVGYTSQEYHTHQPVLAVELIEQLLNRGVYIIGVDFMGLRPGKEHTPMDQLCADRGAFVVENLCNLSAVAERRGVIINTYPMNYAGTSGLPCRVLAQVE